MKQEGKLLIVAGKQMAAAPPVSTSSPAQEQPFPTPSPFSFSAASTRQGSRPSLHLSILLLRFTALVFSFVSAVSLAIPSSKQSRQHYQPSSFADYSQLMYCFIVSVLVFLYSAFQVFKGVCDIAHRGILISDMISDYLTFIFDQLGGYLLMSSSSVGIQATQQIEQSAPLWKKTVVSTTISWATFFVIATCTLLSGYKLCKRISW